MKIKTRETCGKYIEVIIECNNTTIDLGFNNKEEALNLLSIFRQVCDDLESYLELRGGQLV